VDLYAQLDRGINERIGVDVGFTALISPAPCAMDESRVAGFRARYAVIKEFQEQTLALFKASLRGKADPEIAETVVGELPAHIGHSYHLQLTEEQHRTPVFFRTDELLGGKLSEIQCSGSGWGLADQLQLLYRDNPDVFGPSQQFTEPLPRAFASALRRYLGADPVVHHLVDNASRPHGTRYFIQRAREYGVRYFSYDRHVTPESCNFIRSHDFVSLLHNNFHADRMERCKRGEVFFDLSPSCLFDAKVTMAWPFWKKTRGCYSDAVRDMLPYTAIIEPGGFDLEEDVHLALDDFVRIPHRKRDFFIKYAGNDVALNWGSRSVFLADVSNPQLLRILGRTVEDRKRNRYWIIQQAIRAKQPVAFLNRDGVCEEMQAYPKFSGFYGPSGLMALLVFQRTFAKVHGGTDTVLSLVH